jgi:hypothetical protein
MSSDSPFNLFGNTAKKAKQPIDAGSTPPPTEVSKPVQRSPIPIRNYTVEAMLERMNEMRQELDNKIEEASSKHGLSKEKVMEYLNNPKNFTSEQWAFLKGKHEAFTQKIQSNLGASVELPGTDNSSSTGTLTGSRKNKLPGSRRNWIPTR